MPLFILFVIIPVIEITVLIKVGGFLGLFPTIGLILLTAMIGVTLLRVQGLSTLMRASESMQRGGLPAKEMAEGFLLALAGALLLTPGFVTDTFGFLLLTPGIRSQLATKILRLALQKGTIVGGSMGGMNMGRGPFQPGEGDDQRPGPERRGPGDVIEGEYRRED